MLSKRPGWQPPHCPNPNCKHHKGSTDSWRYKRKGWYMHLAHPRRIRRFTCLHCGRNFSTQTFSTTYWQKLPHLDRKIFLLTIGCIANRQIARALDVAVEVDTGFFLFHTDSPLRRKGRMTANQKKRRQELEAKHGRPDPQSVCKGMAELLHFITRRRDQITIRSDEHLSYPLAMKGLPSGS